MKKYLTTFLFLGLFSVSQNLSLKADITNSCCLANNGNSVWCECLGPCNGLNPACWCNGGCPSNAKRITLTPEQFRHHQEIMKEYKKSNPSD